MNDVVTTGTELVVIRALVPAVVFAEGGVEAVLSKLETEVRAIKTDISTAKGRAAIASLAYKVARSKTALDTMGKDLGEDFRKKVETINADRRTIRARLDALAEEVRKPLTDWENAEKARVETHERELAAMEQLAIVTVHDPSVALFDQRLAELEAMPARNWQEFMERATETRARVHSALRAGRAAAEKIAAERAELERLRREEEARKQREHEERIAAEAAEKARREAEAKAAAQAASAAEVARKEQERIEREKAEAIEKAEAEKRRVEAERLRAEREKADAIDAAKRADEKRIAAEAKAKADAAAAAKREEENRRALEAKAKAYAEAAVQAERKRAADAKAAEDAAERAREANKRHRAKINNEAKAALIAAGLSDQAAVAAVTAIAKGEVPHVRISY